MNILLIGSGGREHALLWTMAKSNLADTIYVTPGNGGMGQLAKITDLNTNNHQAVIDFAKNKKIGLVVIGPEAPLVDGLADSLEKEGIKAFGPSAKAAQLEGSKGFTKDLCKRHSIPTAAYERFDNPEKAKAYLQAVQIPTVVKADGLAAGKGVIIAATLKEAEDAIDEIFSGAFGKAGAEVVIEDFLEGEEASFFALVDGRDVIPLATAQDHKRVGDGDKGPNTGGMGAYSPAPVMTEELCQQTMDRIVVPTVKAMAAEGMPYKGVLYAGLMITKSGPQLIEYNCRFGDPECQSLMMRLKSDLVDLMLRTAERRLEGTSIEWDTRFALNVVMAAKGYPGVYEKGSEIRNIPPEEDDMVVFHAGTKQEGGKIFSNGGRVLNVTALGSTVRDAQKRAYAAVQKIDWPEGFYRKDIGWRAIEREKGK